MNARPLRFRPVAGQSLLGPLALALLLLLGTKASLAAPRTDWTAARNRMVDEEIVAAGVKNPRVVQAMRDTPRHEFVASVERDNAYFDMALPIGEGQTISPPFVVAYMTEQLDPQPEDKVLEIGTGSGYQAAILAELGAEVVTVERHPELSRHAADRLADTGYDAVRLVVGDGTRGWPNGAPYQAILVTAGGPSIPQPLLDQLDPNGGRLVMPVGARDHQQLTVVRRQGTELLSELREPVVFVPLIGEFGVAEDGRR
jgi:protein-L-isoaspartate(D-aspartate) O-methyltransferase